MGERLITRSGRDYAAMLLRFSQIGGGLRKEEETWTSYLSSLDYNEGSVANAHQTIDSAIAKS